MIAPVRKTVRVKAPIAPAFEVFTSGLGRWWPHNHTLSRKPIARIMMEPHLGGRWLEIAEDGTQCVVATIIAWEPPHRFAMFWQINARWQPDATMKSEVDVRFTADGSDATIVAVTHHKFETMGAEDGASLRNDVDRGWPGVVELFVREVEVERDLKGERAS